MGQFILHGIFFVCCYVAILRLIGIFHQVGTQSLHREHVFQHSKLFLMLPSYIFIGILCWNVGQSFYCPETAK